MTRARVRRGLLGANGNHRLPAVDGHGASALIADTGCHAGDAPAWLISRRSRRARGSRSGSVVEVAPGLSVSRLRTRPRCSVARVVSTAGPGSAPPRVTVEVGAAMGGQSPGPAHPWWPSATTLPCTPQSFVRRAPVRGTTHGRAVRPTRPRGTSKVLAREPTGPSPVRATGDLQIGTRAVHRGARDAHCRAAAHLPIAVQTVPVPVRSLTVMAVRELRSATLLMQALESTADAVGASASVPPTTCVPRRR